MTRRDYGIGKRISVLSRNQRVWPTSETVTKVASAKSPSIWVAVGRGGSLATCRDESDILEGWPR